MTDSSEPVANDETSRGFPLIMLFVFTAIAAVFAYIAAVVFDFFRRDAISTDNFIGAALGCGALSAIAGAFAGFFQQRWLTSVPLGFCVGLVVGGLFGATLALPEDGQKMICPVLYIGALLNLLIGLAARSARRKRGSNRV